MNRNAFTLIEVVISIFILSFFLITIFRFQAGSIISLFREKELVQMIFPIKNEIYMAWLRPSQLKKIESPQKSEIQTTLNDISKDSELYPFKDKLKIIRSQVVHKNRQLSFAMIATVADKKKGEESE